MVFKLMGWIENSAVFSKKRTQREGAGGRERKTKRKRRKKSREP